MTDLPLCDWEGKPIHAWAERLQVPLFEAFGTPESQKKHLTFPSGHSSYGWTTELFAEVVAWLDELFGEPLR